MAQIKKKSEFAGIGCLVQFLGLLMPVILGILIGIPGVILGIIFTVVLLIVGSFMSVKWVCGNCGNRLEDAGVKMCPTCKERLEPRNWWELT